MLLDLAGKEGRVMRLGAHVNRLNSLRFPANPFIATSWIAIYSTEMMPRSDGQLVAHRLIVISALLLR